MRVNDSEHWTGRDALWGVTFLVVGSLTIAVALLAMRNGLPAFFWGLAWVVGPILVVLGLRAAHQGVRAGRGAGGRPTTRAEDESQPRIR